MVDGGIGMLYTQTLYTEDADFLCVWGGTYGSTVYHICLGIQTRLWNADKIASVLDGERGEDSKAGVYLPGTELSRRSECLCDRQDSDVSKVLTRARAITFPYLD